MLCVLYEVVWLCSKLHTVAVVDILDHDNDLRLPLFHARREESAAAERGC